MPWDACLFRFDNILNIYDTMLSSVAQQLVETIESESEERNNNDEILCYLGAVHVHMALA